MYKQITLDKHIRMRLDLRKPGFHAQLQIFRNTEFNYLKYYNITQEGKQMLA